MSLLLICKILGLFVNLLAADEKYSLLNRDNLSAFLEYGVNFEHFECN